MTAIIFVVYFVSIRYTFADRAFSCFNSTAQPRNKTKQKKKKKNKKKANELIQTLGFENQHHTKSFNTLGSNFVTHS